MAHPRLRGGVARRSPSHCLRASWMPSYRNWRSVTSTASAWPCASKRARGAGIAMPCSRRRCSSGCVLGARGPSAQAKMLDGGWLFSGQNLIDTGGLPPADNVPARNEPRGSIDPFVQPSAVMPVPPLDLHHRHLALSRRRHSSPTTPLYHGTSPPRPGRNLSRS